ncbi:hypothetical protein VF14_34130 [Nostoc linckia z18]|jgi:hypothetical protein|uniref:Uncharacterized protein n=2 Tax=Nostoc linckia TaxID=92942 RepID=A0A9Q5Z5Z9_NOSLI|nr:MULTISPECIES: hypothetical protein [Nostoc]MDZ8013606.1 hypothetical protein [Nostoc sp. ZfuVER08]PHK34373.1 hypothetical protein VF12_23930 [Nostoc linckia z15]PHK39871.1 hypothetical protein VF13_33800 [Nostoc linckia z16]MBC1240696.1 hypothetical protein [Nostoc sp. 2RC]PHJ55930.1 hypothetical protein VF02_34825 [Nostoc linckia z1]
MANITLSELYVSGSELFVGTESFLNDLSDADAISGGNYGGFSDISTLTKLAEAYVDTYAIGHITFVAKSYSNGTYY